MIYETPHTTLKTGKLEPH